MSNVYNFTFDNMSRIGNDQCFIDQNTIQDAAACTYMTQNFFASDCSMRNPISLATTQPGIMYNGGHNIGAGGCNVDTNSKLMIGTIQTHPKCRIDLFQRPFATVPFLGRGSVNPIMESQILQGEMNINKRSVTNLGEKSYIKYHQTPLLPVIRERMTNTTGKIESDASEGWIRGGVPSRELTRDVDYFNKHSTFQYA